MSKFGAKRVFAMVAGLLVGLAAGSALAPSPASAAPAGECLAGPKGPAPQGGRWHYRLDRATKQKCWYVKTRAKEPAETVASTEMEPTPRAAPASKRPSLQTGVADARAELPLAQPPVEREVAPAAPAHAIFPTAPAAAEPAPQGNTSTGWTQSSRWMDHNSAARTAEPAAGPETATEVAEPAGAEPAAVDAPPQLPAANAAQRTDGGSVGMLVGALAAALAFAGLAVGAIMKFGARPKPVRRDGLFDAPPQFEPTPEPMVDELPVRAEHAVEPPPMNWIRVARERHRAEQDRDEIEQLLAHAAPRASA